MKGQQVRFPPSLYILYSVLNYVIAPNHGLTGNPGSMFSGLRTVCRRLPVEDPVPNEGETGRRDRETRSLVR
ncbi:hypothetical protein RRF57_002887 [Xylaria bambusicola]|uniref:Uncharacterized protein n=1 Tax=Xylaria bambusicola TaxID=326684 RepID=A0AAN7Z2W0_9PEZI